MAISPVDRELMNGLKAQQPKALENLYDCYGGMMYGLAFKILGDRQEAEDLIQDIFLKLWQTCTYDPERGTLQSFLLLLVRSRALDRLRSRKSRFNRVEQFEHQILSETSKHFPLDAVASDEISQRVQDALIALPEKQRKALELSYFGGFSQQEIANLLEVPLGTVKSYFRLSFNKLRQALQDLVH
ncbi:MAG: sigma-70 family RNA polymerase sigma factor [Leptolyngbyaceae bacterium]|nr:sigma-70 family RNA polymerase sigma factor [Leptolyngbyaceae bacterium]